jgi:hypothetical protein
MRQRFIIFLLVCGVILGGCKKTNSSGKAKPKPTPASAASVAATTPGTTPSPSPTRPPIDKTAEVVVFG